jgi:hypothetical protein
LCLLLDVKSAATVNIDLTVAARFYKYA